MIFCVPCFWADPDEGVPIATAYSDDYSEVKELPSMVKDPRTGETLVAVKVPKGVKPGDAILVQHPNGTGRFLEAVTPEGMTSGSTFYVKASMKPVGPTPVCSTPEEIKEPKRDYKKLKAFQDSIRVARESEAPFSEALDERNDTPSKLMRGNMKVLEVVVPEGVKPGSVVHVQVPGERRRIAAQVPYNCKKFHVTYEPRRQ